MMSPSPPVLETHRVALEPLAGRRHGLDDDVGPALEGAALDVDLIRRAGFAATLRSDGGDQGWALPLLAGPDVDARKPDLGGGAEADGDDPAAELGADVGGLRRGGQRSCGLNPAGDGTTLNTRDAQGSADVAAVAG